MEKKSLARQVLREFIGNSGVMDRLFCGGSNKKTSMGTDFMKQARKHGIDLHVTNPDHHNQSRCDKRNFQEVVPSHAQKEGPTQIMGLQT